MRLGIGSLNELLSQQGRSTHKLFVQRTHASCLALQIMRQHHDQNKPIVCILDSGGGSWMQFSSAFLRVCLAHNIRPFFLPAWTTKWLMPLDQVAHATMSKKWARLKQLLAQRQQSLTLYMARQCHRWRRGNPKPQTLNPKPLNQPQTLNP